MKLYYFETPNARKACAVARYLNAPVEFVRVDLTKGEHKAPAFLAINPNGKVPALEDGEVRLWESAAIMCYLADRAGSGLWPKDARQIDVIRWLSWDAMHFSRHAGTLFFQQVVKPHFGLGDPDLAAIDEAMGFFRQFAGVLNSHLKAGATWSATGSRSRTSPSLPSCRTRTRPGCRSTSSPRSGAGMPSSSNCRPGASRSRPRRRAPPDSPLAAGRAKAARPLVHRCYDGAKNVRPLMPVASAPWRPGRRFRFDAAIPRLKVELLERLDLGMGSQPARGAHEARQAEVPPGDHSREDRGHDRRPPPARS